MIPPQKGAGEEIRGNINQFVDAISGSHEADERNRRIIERGEEEMKYGYHGHHALPSPGRRRDESAGVSGLPSTQPLHEAQGAQRATAHEERKPELPPR